MCVIMILKPGQMPPLDYLENATYNNWHSWGLVTRVNGLLDIQRVVPDTGEVCPKEVWDALERDREHERILHLRHTTAGETNLENCHPFDVFYSKDKKKGVRQVVFMHNGTLHPFKSRKTNQYGSLIDDDSGPSDTKNFVDQILIPLLSATDFGEGRGDITNPFIYKMIKAQWSGDNRGILIANDQTPLLIGNWKKIEPVKDDPETHFLASNDSYFDKVIRGPEYDRRKKAEEERKRKETEERSSRTFSGAAVQSDRQITSLKDLRFERQEEFSVTLPLLKALGDFRIYDREFSTKLGYATKKEIEELLTDGYKDTASFNELIHLIDHVFADYACLYEEYKTLESEKFVLKRKHDAATSKIAELIEDREALVG